jgi:hypothetical protein
MEKKEEGPAEIKWRFGDTLNGVSVQAHLYTIFSRAFFYQLKQYLPVFAMKFRRVDKLRFKHSRGKSGKYTVEWKYIPTYKRLDVVLRWLVEDVMLQKANQFKTQIWKSLYILLTTPSLSAVKKNRDYVHKHVYARYKNSLIRTLKKI